MRKVMKRFEGQRNKRGIFERCGMQSIANAFARTHLYDLKTKIHNFSMRARKGKEEKYQRKIREYVSYESHPEKAMHALPT